MGQFVVPPPERRLDCEKVAARLASREAGAAREKEPWDAFLHRIGVIDG